MVQQAQFTAQRFPFWFPVMLRIISLRMSKERLENTSDPVHAEGKGIKEIFAYFLTHMEVNQWVKTILFSCIQVLLKWKYSPCKKNVTDQKPKHLQVKGGPHLSSKRSECQKTHISLTSIHPLSLYSRESKRIWDASYFSQIRMWVQARHLAGDPSMDQFAFN